jgi:3-keto-disaccharide hydrolase
MRHNLHMRYFLTSLILACTLPAFAQNSGSAFVGRWDFDLTTPSGVGANWLGVSEKGGNLEIWFQPTGGHVYRVKNFHLEGSHLSFTASPASRNHPAMTWDLEAAGGKLTGVQKEGDRTTPLTGSKAPELKRSAPKAWTEPEALFNGKNLDGWEPIGNASKSHWVVKDGLLVNEAHGANLRSTRTFDDFKVHFEVNCPDKANSGFYLRGRYEMQLEYEPESSEPMERQMGSIYGRLAPSKELPRTPGQWETFDITLVGRTVTVVRNGVKVIDRKEIEGITGGALNADEGEPGPFYIQGDHTGGLQFRNITVAVPKG